MAESSNPYLDDLRGLEEETRLRSEEARRKVSDSRRELEASGYDLSSSAAQALASITGSEAAQRVADRHKKVAQVKRDNTDFTQSLWDVDGVGSALSYAHKTAIDAVPSLALAAAGGGAGVALRAGLAGRSALAAATSPSTAAGAGMFAATYLPNTGEVFDAMREQAGDGNENVLAGVALGAGSTALDLLGVGRVARETVSRTGHAIEGSLARRAGVTAAKTAGEEGWTEAAQNLASEAGRAVVDPSGYSFDKEALKRTVESGVAGAIGGIGPGAVHGVSSGRKRTNSAVDKGPGGEASPTPSADPVSASSTDPMSGYKGDKTERIGPNGEVISEVDARAVQTADGTMRLRSTLEAESTKAADLLARAGGPVDVTALNRDAAASEPSYGPNGEVIDNGSSIVEDTKKADFGYQGSKIGSAYEQHLRDLQERDRPDLAAKLPNARSSDPTGARALVPMGTSSLIVGDRADNLRLSVGPLELAKRSTFERGGRTTKEGVPTQTKLEENWAESLSDAIKKGPESVTEFITGVRMALDKETPTPPRNPNFVRSKEYQKKPGVVNSQRFGFFEKVATEYLKRHQDLTNKTSQDLKQAQTQQVQQAAVQQQAQAMAQQQAQAQQAEQEANLTILDKAMIGNEPKSMEHVIKSFKGLRAELAPQQKDAPVPPYILKIAEDVAREHATQQVASKVMEEQKKLQEENKKALEAEQKAKQDEIDRARKSREDATKAQLDIEKKAQDIAQADEQAKADKEADVLKSNLEKKVAESKAKTESKTDVRADNSAPQFEKQISRLEKQLEEARKAVSPENLHKVVNEALAAEGSDIKIGLEKVKTELQKFKAANENKGGVPSLQERVEAAKKEATDKVENKPETKPARNEVQETFKAENEGLTKLNKELTATLQWKLASEQTLKGKRNIGVAYRAAHDALMRRADVDNQSINKNPLTTKEKGLIEDFLGRKVDNFFQRTLQDVANDVINKPELPGESSVKKSNEKYEPEKFRYKNAKTSNINTTKSGFSRLVPPRARTKEQLANIPNNLKSKFTETGENSVQIPDDLKNPTHLFPFEIQKSVEAWTKGWKNLPEVHVLDVENLPNNEIGHYAKLVMEKLLPAKTVADGQYARINGRPVVLLFSNFIQSLDQAKGTLFHETLGHYGLRDYWGTQREELLNEIYRTTPSMRKEIGELHQHYSNKDIASKVEEALVRRFNGGEQVEPSAMGLIRTLVRKFLKMMGWANPPLAFSQGELNNILFAGQENVKSNVESSAREERAGRASTENTGGVVFNNNNSDFDVVPAKSKLREQLSLGENSIREAAEASIAKLPENLKPMARTTYNNMQSMAKQGLHMASSLRDFVNRNAEKLPALRDYHTHMLARDAIAREMEANLEKAMLPSQEVKGVEKRREMAKVGIELSRLGEWPFQPSWRTDHVDVTAKATALWNTLDDKQKTALEALYKYGHEALVARAEAVKGVINQRLEGKIWDSLSPGEKDEVKKDVARQLKIWDTKINQVKGPYVPFSRFGKYATVVRSPEFMKLEKQIEDSKDKASKEDLAKLDEMRTDQDHYRVMFSKSLGVAKELELQIKNEPDYKGMHIESFQREAIYKQMQSAPWAGLQNMVETIKSELGSTLSEAQQRQIEDALKDIYFKALAENSTRRHLSKRKNVPGMSENLLHGFAETGKSDASFTANVRKNKDITESINEMRKQRDEGNREGSDDRNDKSLIVNEVLHRHAMGMATRATPIVDTITNVTSAYFLLSSFRYYIQQAIQTPMMSAPYMSGRFGAAKTWPALFQSAKDLSKSIPSMWDFAIKGKFDTGTLHDDGTVTGGTLKDSNGRALPQDELQMINHLRQAGVLDVGLQYELGSWENYGDKGFKSEFKNVMHTAKKITRAMEIGNRMSAGLAGYRMARESGMNYEQARNYTEQMLADTHGDYTAVDRPRAFGLAGSPGKLFFQFRRYSHAVGSMLAKQTYAAFKDSNPTEKRIARKVMTYMLAQTALVTGTMGLPMVSTIAYLMAAAFGPPDEPADADRWLRNAIGDDNIADIILKGIPNVAGLDLQSMLGMENVFKVAPFVEPDFTTRDKAASTIFYGLGGAFGGLVGRGADALGHLGEGNYWKGAENLSPGSMRTALSAIREHNYGVTKKNGDMVISPEEFSFLESFMKGIGLNTTHMETIRRDRNDMFKLDEYFKDRTNDIRKEYVEARKNKDADKQSELRDQWKALQEAKKRYNLDVSPLSNLLSAETQVSTREQRYKELLKKFSARN